MSIYQNPTIIRIGDFFFKYRNKVFPLIIVLLFLTAPPPTTVFGEEGYEVLKDWLMFGVSVAGLVIRGMVIGFAYIKRGGKNKEVYADKLVTEGMFSTCRNPLYFGNMLIYIGIFIEHGDPLIIFTGIPLFYFIYICIIATEENYLRKKFGGQYDDYAAVTNRWVIDFSKFRTATKDMHFNFMKVIIKDYPTIFTTILIFLLIEQYENFAGNEEHSLGYKLLLMISSLGCFAMMGVVRYMKKKKFITF